MTLGVGPMTPDGIDLSLSYCFARGEIAYRGALDYGGEFAIFGDPSYYSILLNGQVGRRSFSRYFLLAQFAGPSVVYYVERHIEGTGNERVRRRISPGLALDAQFFAKPLGLFLPEIGVGMEVFANLNLLQSFYGLRISILFHNTI